MNEAHLTETLLHSEDLLRGHFLHVKRDLVQLPDGLQTTREYVVHPGAAVIVAIADDGRLVMERQYRHPLGAVMLEFPAGKFDLGESHWGGAMRELEEETGYRAREWAYAGVMHNAAAYSTEAIELWFARDLVPGLHRLDEGELIDVCLMTADELDRLAAAGKLTDAKTLIGLLWLQKWRGGHWPLVWQAVETAPNRR